MIGIIFTVVFLATGFISMGRGDIAFATNLFLIAAVFYLGWTVSSATILKRNIFNAVVSAMKETTQQLSQKGDAK